MNAPPYRIALKRLQPKASLKPVNFMCNLSMARSVSLVGDFNGWRISANPMKRQTDGVWLLTVEMKPGHHRYAFSADGELHLDPRAMGITRNEKGERVSLIAVS